MSYIVYIYIVYIYIQVCGQVIIGIGHLIVSWGSDSIRFPFAVAVAQSPNCIMPFVAIKSATPPPPAGHLLPNDKTNIPDKACAGQLISRVFRLA